MISEWNIREFKGVTRVENNKTLKWNNFSGRTNFLCVATKLGSVPLNICKTPIIWVRQT